MSKGTGIKIIKTEKSNQNGEYATKYVFKAKDGRTFEASGFWQPNLNRYDLGISSMSGCLMGCKICECTYKRLGNEGILSSDEIIYQIETIMNDAFKYITVDKKPWLKLTDYQFDIKNKFNSMVLVSFMGNGDPLGNINNVVDAVKYSNAKYGETISRFGVSTICPKNIDIQLSMKKLLDCEYSIGKEIWLQYSALSMDAKKRRELMPSAISLYKAKKYVDEYARKSGRPSRYNFPMIKGVNNSRKHLDKIGEFISENIKLRNVKISMYNKLENNIFKACSREEVINIKKYLELQNIGLVQYHFPSNSNCIAIACGQLRGNI